MAKRLVLAGKAKKKLAIGRAAIKAGMRIIAITPGSKAPDTRFCPRGSDSGTKDVDIMRGWLHEAPDIGLAAVTKGSDILVIDIDGPEGEEAVTAFGPLPATRETQTRDGRHLFFRHDGSIKGSRIGLQPKLDIIASGYVLLPGSTHPEGGRYKSDDIHAPIADLPASVIASINAKASPEDRPAAGGTIKVGGRNNRLTSLAGAFRRQGFDENVILASLTAVNEACCRPPLSQKSLTTIARSVGRYDPADDGLFEIMSNVTPREVDFLWAPYLVSGAVNLLEGDPNVGKTYLLCAIAAAVSAGRPLPGQEKIKAGNVLFLSAEDDPETTLVRRLMRMGADLKRITFMTKFHRLEEEPLTWVEKHIDEHGVTLMIMDPLLAYMQGGIDMNKANETRPFMARLSELAKARNVTIIGLRHLNKSDKEKAIFRGLGSIDITAAARSAIMIGEHPEDPALRAMVHIKHNLSERGATQLYELVGGGLGTKEVPKLKWRGPSDLGPDDFARAAGKPGRPDTAIQDAKAYLERVLAAGPRPIASVMRDGERYSFSERTLRRAAREIGVVKEGKTWAVAKNTL